MDHKVPLLHLITSLSDIGGAEKVLFDLATNSIKSRFYISVASISRNKNQLAREFLRHNIQTETLEIEKNIIQFIKALSYLNKKIRKEKIEIIHAHMFHAMVMAGILKLVNPRLKIVFTSHNFNVGSRLRELILFLFKPLRNIDIIFSKDMLRFFYKKKHAIIPNGINLENYQKKTEKFDRFTFIAVGRLERVKNHRHLIDVAKELEDYDFQILIAGKGSLLDELEKLTEDSGVKDKVSFLGMRNDIPELFAKSHVMLLSSLWEGMPLTILEAGASGLPVISTRVGSIPSILNNNNSYLSSLNDFKKKMVYVMKNYNKAIQKATMLKNNIVDEYSIDKIVKKHEDVYLQLLRK